jgi:hypothetical protein
MIAGFAKHRSPRTLGAMFAVGILILVVSRLELGEVNPFLALSVGILFLAAPLIRLLIEGPEFLIGWMRREKYSEWMGRHFVFEITQIRIHWDRETIWINAHDIFLALEQSFDSVGLRKLAARLGSTNIRKLHSLDEFCFSDEGVCRYLKGLRTESATRCLRWLEREVFPNIRKLREMDSDTFTQHELDSGRKS